jgi:hypothetical protein
MPLIIGEGGPGRQEKTGSGERQLLHLVDGLDELRTLVAEVAYGLADWPATHFGAGELRQTLGFRLASETAKRSFLGIQQNQSEFDEFLERRQRR